MIKEDRIADCTTGSHRPDGNIDRDVTGIQRSHCRACGCALMRTAAMPRWYFSGLLG